MKPIYWQTYFYFWCREDTENHCSVPKTEATRAAWRVQNSNSSALFRQILYGLFTFLPDNSCVVSKATEEADLSRELNEIISLTFISRFIVSPVNTEDATTTRKKDPLVHSEWGNMSSSEVIPNFSSPKLWHSILAHTEKRLMLSALKMQKAQFTIRHQDFHSCLMILCSFYF